MPRRLFLALLLLVAAPVVLLGWMSASAVKANQVAAKESLASLLSSQLHDADRRISTLFDGYSAELDAAIDSGQDDVDSLRRMRRKMPIVRQGIIVDSNGYMVFPTPDDSVDVDARAVAAALPGLIDSRPAMTTDNDSKAAKPNSKPAASKSRSAPSASKQAMPLQRSVPAQKGQQAEQARWTSKWQQWYLSEGAQVVYWRTRSDGHTIGILLERSRWIADLIAVLPDDSARLQRSETTLPKLSRSFDSQALSPTPIGSVSLVDEAKRAVFRWGKTSEFQLPPLVSIELSEPLASWQMRLYVNQSVVPKTSPWPMYLSLGAMALLLLSVGFYVLTSVQRQISQAKSRVSFAGQVSHELRTPLTNIRLYTELAESDLQRVEESEARGSLAKRLDVINHESRRLQRLVTGVLEMIRPSGKRVGVRRQHTDLVELIDGIAQQFQPSFDAAAIDLQTKCGCIEPVSIDPDVVEMVLVNLLSNVEKYVPSGGHCSIECSVEEAASGGADTLRVVVDDDGPGISSMHRARVFRAFERIDDSISAPSGTGIGLTIAQRAAQRHGGNLVLLGRSTLGGSAFRLTLPLNDAS